MSLYLIVVWFYVRVAEEADRPQAVLVAALLDEVARLGLYPVNDDAFAVGSHNSKSSMLSSTYKAPSINPAYNKNPSSTGFVLEMYFDAIGSSCRVNLRSVLLVSLLHFTNSIAI